MQEKIDKSKSKQINQRYKTLMSTAMDTLQVFNLRKSVFESPDRKLNTSGSDLPRAILGYFFSILQLIRENENVPYHPIVIDSPKQQDPDDENQIRLFTFIRNKVARHDQLLLGSVSVPDEVEFPDATIVRLDNKYGALLPEELSGAETKIEPYLREAESLLAEDQDA